MPLFRSYYTCFYCNRKSRQAKKAGLREWDCENCLAKNWLDKHGQITDPPAEIVDTVEARGHIRYAGHQTSTARASCPPTPHTQQANPAVFCPTCEKNQYMYTQTLAEYYPTNADAHSLVVYEEAEADFRQALEERYPLVCEACAPVARERLLQCNRWAKADHIGRITNKLRQHHHQPTTLTSLLTRSAGLMWWTSWLAQIIWHTLGLLQRGEEQSISMTDHDTVTIVRACYTSYLSTHKLPPECLRGYTRHAIYPIICSALLSVWWNPLLYARLTRPLARLRGLAEFYKLVAASLILRAAAAYLITHASLVMDRKQQETMQALHLFMTFFSLCTLICLYRTVSIDTTPKVSFKQDQSTLLASNVRSSVDGKSAASLSSARFDLAPRTPTKSTLPTQPQLGHHVARLSALDAASPLSITPAGADLDADMEMDWTPSLPSIGSNLWAPPSPPKPTFKTTPYKRRHVADPTPPSPSLSEHQIASLTLSPPRFFPPSTSHTADTGLESIMQSTFRIADISPPIGSKQSTAITKTAPDPSRDTHHASYSSNPNTTASTFLFTSLLAASLSVLTYIYWPSLLAMTLPLPQTSPDPYPLYDHQAVFTAPA